MAYDLLIKNAKICDGTGNASFRGAVAVENGKIVGAGDDVTGSARREIDAQGLVLAPGFIDPHTHYDAQISWDPLLTSTCWHGFTTVLMGNCGVGIAPCHASERKTLAWDLVNVEALPYDVLINGVSWEWESFSEYMAAIARHGIVLNAGFLVPLSALRFYVMGDAASERPANAKETERMVALFREAMIAGACGFSISTITRHMGFQGKPLASRVAGKEELAALCRVLRELKRGVIEIALLKQIAVMTDGDLDLLLHLARESQRPVTWLGMADIPGMPAGSNEAVMKRIRPYIAEGLRIPPQVSPRPIRMYYDLLTPSLCGEMPSWKPAFNRSREEQVAFYRSAAFRDEFRADLKARRGAFFNGQWYAVFVTRVEREANQRFMNKSIKEVAALQHKDEVDAFLDLAIDENLALGITVELINANRDEVAKLISYPEIMIGLSDSGAHVSQHCDAGVSTYLLREWVRKQPIMSLETAVRRLTSEPADFLGLTSKGRIAPGMDADLVLFDPDTVGPRDAEWSNDLPGGAARLIERADGVLYSMVAGQVVFADGVYQGGTPGRLVRPAA